MRKLTHLERAYVQYQTDPATITSNDLATVVLYTARVIVNRLASATLDRDELTSVVTSAMWRKLTTGNIEPERVLPTLVAIARNKVRDAWRKHYRRSETHLAGDVLGVETGLGRAEGLLTLPEPHRTTVHALLGTDSVIEAAALLGVTPRTLKRRLQRVREAAEKAGVQTNG